MTNNHVQIASTTLLSRLSFHLKCNFLKIIQIMESKTKLNLQCIQMWCLFEFSFHACSWFISFARSFYAKLIRAMPVWIHFILFCFCWSIRQCFFFSRFIFLWLARFFSVSSTLRQHSTEQLSSFFVHEFFIDVYSNIYDFIYNFVSLLFPLLFPRGQPQSALFVFQSGVYVCLRSFFRKR